MKAESKLKTRKRKTIDPCEICFLHKALCICSLIPRLNLKTRVVLVIHAKELKRTTNTGRLALHALTNSEMFVRGQERDVLDLAPILTKDYDSYLLYPSDDALDLSDIVCTDKPIQLIVPDGNWRQAGKVAIRHPELQNVPRVKLSASNAGGQHLRKEHFANGLSTLEAIGLALGVIEGKDVGEQLLQLYQNKLSATLKGRGVLKTNA